MGTRRHQQTLCTAIRHSPTAGRWSPRAPRGTWAREGQPCLLGACWGNGPNSGCVWVQSQGERLRLKDSASRRLGGARRRGQHFGPRRPPPRPQRWQDWAARRGPQGHERSSQVLGNKVFPETRALGRRLVSGSKDRTGLPQEKLCERLPRNPGFCVDRVTLRCQGRTRPCRACFRSLSEDPGLNRELAPKGPAQRLCSV